ncbi:MAG: hypothetical protein V2I27_03345 [Erythrobacter sp.]|jgi:hypothetical protein|nr:hypothetical protein [Erythrobacter sp.]
MIEFASRLLVGAALIAACPAVAAQEADQAEPVNAPAAMPDAQGASKVYWPDDITPDRVREAREQASIQEQISREREQALLKQLTERERATTGSDQVVNASADEVLAQLSESERQVLLEAVEGTDICDREPESAIIRKLCAERIETRSAEFTRRRTNLLSAEERLLGEGLEGDPVNSVARAVDRLGRNARDVDDPNNQAIASVALAPDAPVGNPGQDPAGTSGAGELSPETQALVDAIVQQFGGGSGSRP